MLSPHQLKIFNVNKFWILFYFANFQNNSKKAKTREGRPDGFQLHGFMHLCKGHMHAHTHGLGTLTCP